jgi:hypothetical protein
MQLMRYRLRTLLILLALMPPLLWFGWERFMAWQEWRTAEQARQALRLAEKRRLAQQRALFRLRTALQIRQIALPARDPWGVVDPNTGLRPVPGERDYQFPPWQPSLDFRIDSLDERQLPPPE